MTELLDLENDNHRYSTFNENQTAKTILFEDALNQTGYGKLNYYLIVISGILMGSTFVETLTISYVLPICECDLLLTTTEKGALGAAGLAGIISSSHYWGFMADTKGRRRILLPTLIAAFICTIISSLSFNFWSFVILRYLNGFFIAGSSATIFTYISEIYPLKYRARAIMLASVIYGTITMLIPIVAWLVINQSWSFHIPFPFNIEFKPWRLYIILCGLPTLISALGFLLLPESPKYLCSQGRQKETIEILQWMHRINEGYDNNCLKVNSIVEEHKSTDETFNNNINNNNNKNNNNHVNGDNSGEGTTEQSRHNFFKLMWLQTKPLFQKGTIRVTILASFIQFAIFVNSNGMYIVFPEVLNIITNYMNGNPNGALTICEILNNNYYQKHTANEILMNNNSSTVPYKTKCITQLEPATYGHSLVLELLFVFGFMFIAALINRFRKFTILFTILFLCGMSAVLVIFVNQQLVSIYLYVILLLAGLAVPVVNAATVDLFATSIKAMAMCLTLMMGRIGGVVGAYIASTFVHNHCNLTFFFAGFVIIFSGFLAIFIPNIMKLPVRPPITQK